MIFHDFWRFQIWWYNTAKDQYNWSVRNFTSNFLKHRSFWISIDLFKESKYMDWNFWICLLNFNLSIWSFFRYRLNSSINSTIVEPEPDKISRNLMFYVLTVTNAPQTKTVDSTISKHKRNWSRGSWLCNIYWIVLRHPWRSTLSV